MDTSLNTLRVAITGGTSGLGLALVKALRRRGAQVAFVARDATRVAIGPSFLQCRAGRQSCRRLSARG